MDSSSNEKIWPKTTLGVARYLSDVVGYQYSAQAIRLMAAGGLIPTFKEKEWERRAFSQQDKEYFFLAVHLRFIGASTDEIKRVNRFLYKLNPDNPSLGFYEK